MMTRGRGHRGGISFLSGVSRAVGRPKKLSTYYKAAKAAGRFVKKNMNPYVGSSLARKLGTIKGRLPSTSKFIPKPKGLIKTSDKLEEDIGTGGQEITTIRRTVRFKGCGKRVRQTKLEKACAESEIYRISGINPFMNTTVAPLNKINSEVGGGAYWLHNYLAANSNLHVPFHVWDVTSMINTQGGTVQLPTVGYGMRFTSNNNAAAGFSIYSMSNQGSNGVVNSLGWTPENVGGSNTDYGIYPEKAALQNWVDINMLCYGAANQATKFKICLFQTKEDYLAPQLLNVIPGTNQFDPQLQLAVNTYEAMVAPYIKHPINKQYYNKVSKQKKINILSELDFIQQPRLNTETDAAVGHCKQVKLFVPLNRVNRYDWAQLNTDTSTITNQASYITEVGWNNTLLHPKARIYLGILATNTSNVTGVGVPSVNFTPSYDLMIRTRYTSIR